METDIVVATSEVKEVLEENVIGRSVAAALSLFRERNMINKKAVRWGRTNDEKKEDSKEEPIMKALDLYGSDGALLTTKEKFRELNLSYHGIKKSHKQKEKMNKKFQKSHDQQNTDIS